MNKKEKKTKKKQDKKAIIKDNLAILTVRNYDESVDAYELEDGTYLDIIEKTSKDLEHSLGDEVEYEMLQMAKFFKVYKGDIKVVALNFPINTARQREHLLAQKEKTNNEIRKKWLDRSIDELLKQDLNATKREYYIFVFSENKEDHLKNKKQIASVLGFQGKSALVKEIPMEKKHRILYKLNNMNSLIVGDEYEINTKKES